jgi:hypothetical protein
MPAAPPKTRLNNVPNFVRSIMALQRLLLLSFAALCAAAIPTSSFAQCGGCGFQFAPGIAPQLVNAPPAPPPVYAPSGCGGCNVEFAPPAYPPAPGPLLAPVPIAPAPIAVSGCGAAFGLFGAIGGCGGCGVTPCGGFYAGYGGFGAFAGGCGGCGGPPAPIYVVPQGPEYSGPGIMIPEGVYSPQIGLANPAEYPYIGRRGPAFGHRFYGYAYGTAGGLRHRGFHDRRFHRAHLAREHHWR